ncbi:glycosyltransferase family 2 protein [Tunicatimonas pelagia]|nr:glycosyltransferase family 2 protein [Tunicatimonas pelagia]WKN46398.1 glycosyltransferase family 2 protein [Tunicatimonas pelagia]
MEVLWWLCLSLVVYTYVGYGIILRLLVGLKRLREKQREFIDYQEFCPETTIVVAAYNEAGFIDEKIQNTLQLDYPPNKRQVVIVTDGSTDATPDIVRQYSEIKLLHQPERRGKIAAVHRTMKEVNTPVVIFTDANTYLNPEAIRNIVRHYQNPQIGGVAGEKRIHVAEKDSASGAGEGFYWKYESALKTWDAELYSVVGAAGELFSVRTELYENIPQDTVIEDFYLTLRIAQKGYRIAYEPDAYAQEGPSASVKEELKRKIRIAAGGIQAIVRLKALLNIFRYGTLSFQYISHRVLRWTVTPFALVLVFVLNILLYNYRGFYQLTFYGQIFFYVAALVGYILANKSIKIKAFFIPYYFFIMNYAVFRGIIRYLKGNQSVTWERAERANVK